MVVGRRSLLASLGAALGLAPLAAAGATVPQVPTTREGDWLLCDGRLVDPVAYPELAAQVPQLPDLRRVRPGAPAAAALLDPGHSHSLVSPSHAHHVRHFLGAGGLIYNPTEPPVYSGWVYARRSNPRSLVPVGSLVYVPEGRTPAGGALA